jgi:hypothetical protein
MVLFTGIFKKGALSLCEKMLNSENSTLSTVLKLSIVFLGKTWPYVHFHCPIHRKRFLQSKENFKKIIYGCVSLIPY